MANRLRTERPAPARSSDAPASDAGDGFTIESASAADTSLAPADTTTIEESASLDAAPAADADDGATDGGLEPAGDGEVEDRGDGTVSASAAFREVAPKTDAKGKAPAQKKGPKSLEDRNGDLLHRNRTATWELRETERKLQKGREELAEIERKKVAATGTPAADGTTAAAAKPASEPAKVADMPAHPNYRDFDTDAAYEKAVAQWRTDVGTWQQGLVESVRSKPEDLTKAVSTAVEQRFDTEAQREAQRVSDEAFGTRLTKARTDVGEAWDTHVEAIRDLTSDWHDGERHGDVLTPFLSDVMRHNEGDGTSLIPWLASDLERAQVVANLRPTRAMRDSFVTASSAIKLFEHFSTPEGRQEWEKLRSMPSVRVHQLIGALSSRLEAAPSGSAPARQPVTNARPSGKPPAASAEARGGGSPTAMPAFDDWMAEEDAKEKAARREALGVPA